MRMMPVPDLLLPGHPGADATPQNPCLLRSAGKRLGQGIDDLEKVLSRYASDGARLPGWAKQLLKDLYYLGEFEKSSVFGLFASSRFFVVNAPGGPGLVEHLGAALRQLGREPAVPTAVLLTSCGPSETAGLRPLVEKYRTAVVARGGRHSEAQGVSTQRHHLHRGRGLAR